MSKTPNHQNLLPMAGAVTSHYDFHPATASGEKLFSVRAGIPLSDAFNDLSMLLKASMASIDLIACECPDQPDGIPAALWNSIHLMNFSYALIQSMHTGHVDHEMRLLSQNGRV